ncbi:MAG: HEPN domain-containing protein [Elusimicrobiota bacterium]|nr:HEPN domain-containing protein [Elusimicrobiota bacterium]
MKSNDSIEKLGRQNLIKKCPIDYRAIANLIRRAKTDIDTAKRNVKIDDDCSFNYAYNAMLHTGIALMFSEGYRPEIRSKHLTIIRFVNALLGDKFSVLINMYDYMRKKRHQFIYEPDIPCTSKEAEDVIKNAEEFFITIATIIRKKNPQQEFDL